MQAKKLSNAGWDKTREETAKIFSAPPERQAEWLWSSFAVVTGATFLEREGLAGEPPAGC